MNNHVIIDEIRAHIKERQYTEAVAKLERVQVQKLTGPEQDEINAWIPELPRETVESSVELCYNLVLLQIQRGDLAAAKKRINNLIAMRDVHKEGAHKRQFLENRIFCASLCMPVGPGSNLLLSLAVLANEFADAKFPLARLSATGKFPSVLRGDKDLSGLGKHYRASASIVKPLLWACLEDSGAGVCEAAVAELLYERNDLNGASLQAAGAINAQNPEIAFVGLATLARLGAVDTTSKPPPEILAHIGEMLEKTEAHWLMPNYRALRARFDILRGDLDKVREWVEQCGLNDLDSFILRDSYILVTKAKANIATGEYSNAARLLESLALAFQREQRPLDTIECLVNGAIVCELLGSTETAMQKLEQALLMAQEYGYIRVFADCGRQLFHLIVKYAREYKPHEDLSDAYIRKITEAAKIFSTLCPALYERKNDKDSDGRSVELTQSELLVLQLLDQGSSNKNIAKELSVSASTVKFHISNIFEKLEAANRVEAVKNARNLGMLP